jgi:hypothetical protein
MTTIQATTRNTQAANVKTVGFDRFKTGLMPKTDQLSGSTSNDVKRTDMIEIPGLKTMHVIVCGEKDVIKEMVRAMAESEDALGLKAMESARADYRPNCVSISIKLEAFDLKEAYDELQDRFFSNVALRCGVGIMGNKEEDVKPAFDGALDSLNLSFQAAF